MKTIPFIFITCCLYPGGESTFPTSTSGVTGYGQVLNDGGSLRLAFSMRSYPIVYARRGANPRIPIFVGNRVEIQHLLRKYPQLRYNVRISNGTALRSLIPTVHINEISALLSASGEVKSNNIGMPYGHSVQKKLTVSYGNRLLPVEEAEETVRGYGNRAPSHAKPVSSYSKPVSSYPVPETVTPGHVAAEEPQPTPEMQDLPTVNESSWNSQVSSSNSSTSSQSENASNSSSFSSSVSVMQTVSNGAVKGSPDVTSEPSQPSTQDQVDADSSGAVLQNVSVQQSVNPGSNSGFSDSQLPVVPISPSLVSDNVIRPASRAPSSETHPITNSSQSELGQKCQEEQSKSSEIPQAVNVTESPTSNILMTTAANQVNNVVQKPSENTTKMAELASESQTSPATPLNSDQILQVNHQKSESSSNETSDFLSSNTTITSQTVSSGGVALETASDNNQVPKVNLRHPFLTKLQKLTSNSIVRPRPTMLQRSRRASDDDDGDRFGEANSEDDVDSSSEYQETTDGDSDGVDDENIDETEVPDLSEMPDDYIVFQTKDDIEDYFAYVFSRDQKRCVAKLVCMMAHQPDMYGLVGHQFDDFFSKLDITRSNSPLHLYAQAALNGKLGEEKCTTEYPLCDDTAKIDISAAVENNDEINQK